VRPLRKVIDGRKENFHSARGGAAYEPERLFVKEKKIGAKKREEREREYRIQEKTNSTPL